MPSFFKYSSDTISGSGTVTIYIKKESVIIEGLFDDESDRVVGFFKYFDINYLPLQIILNELINETDINLEYLRGNYWTELSQDETHILIDRDE